MEPRQEEKKDKQPRSEGKEEKPRRFRIINLEERIAPGGGKGNGSNLSCEHTICKGRCGC